MLKPGLPVQAVDLAEPIQAALNPARAAAGFASVRPLDHPLGRLTLPPWFIDRCRQAYLALSPSSGQRVLGITSARSGEGKTSVAVGLAAALAADTRQPTVLFECDLEHPSYHQIFGFPRDGGLGEWLEGTSPVRVLRTGFLANALVIPAGAPQREPARLFHRLAQCDPVRELRRHFQNVIVDLPPILDIAYSALAQRLTETILLVARDGTTRIEDLERVSHLLGRERIGGIILNGTDYRTPLWLRRLL